MELELKIATEEDAGLWDKIIESSPQSTIFHTWKCLKIIEKHSKTELYPLIVQSGTIPIGCFPVFYQKKLWMKLIFSPPPHVALSRLGPVMVDYDGLTYNKRESNTIGLQKKVDEFICSEINPDYLTYASAYLQDSRGFMWANYYIEPTYNYSFCLTDELEKMWLNIRKKTRDDIKRAQKRGISVREGNKEDLLLLFELMVKRYAEQRRKVSVPEDYLLELYELLHPSNLRVFVVEHKGDIITGNIDVYFGDKVITWIGAPKAVEHANDLLTWECIKWAHENGYKHYCIMGVAGTERLYSFYSKFNPDLMVSFSAKKYSSKISKLISDFVEESAKVRRWINNV
jgi:hypothetical protein